MKTLLITCRLRGPGSTTTRRVPPEFTSCPANAWANDASWKYSAANRYEKKI